MRSFFQIDPNDVLTAYEKTFNELTTGYIQHLNSLENRVFEIELEKSDGKKIRKILKFYRPGRWSREALEEEHHLLRKLNEIDVHVVEPENFGGKTLFQFNDTFWTCFPKQGGYVEHELNTEKLLSLGRILGKFHRFTNTFQFKARPSFVARLDLENSFKLVADVLEAEGLKAKFATHYTEFAKRFSGEINKYPNHPIHGDLHAANLLWPKDNECRLLDFDDSCTGPFFQDVWMLVHNAGDFYTFMEGYEEFGSAQWLGAYSDERRDLYRLARMVSYWGWLLRRKEDPYIKHFFPNLDSQRYWEDEISAWLGIWQNSLRMN